MITNNQRRWWRFAVIRGDGIPAEMDGRWYDLDSMSDIRSVFPLRPGLSALLGPTNKWECREDGEVAVVYEWTKVRS